MKRILIDLLRDPLIFSMTLAVPFVAFLVATSYVLYLHNVPGHVTSASLVFLSLTFASLVAKFHKRFLSRQENT